MGANKGNSKLRFNEWKQQTKAVMEARPASWNVSVEQSLRLMWESLTPREMPAFHLEAPQAGATYRISTRKQRPVCPPGWA